MASSKILKIKVLGSLMRFMMILYPEVSAGEVKTSVIKEIKEALSSFEN
ncbi:hypothetical protein [Adhaeribacter pallidiroseus]|nr:hypothetical protein [Adhaeribacter pallidiroseus]